VTETVHHTLSMCVPIISMGALGAWHATELNQKSRPACSYPCRTFHSSRYTARLDKKNCKQKHAII